MAELKTKLTNQNPNVMTMEKEKVVNSEFEDGNYVLCLCNGNVLRSQVAADFLNKIGVNAKSAAVDDIAKQKIQGTVPRDIFKLTMGALGLSLMNSPIKRVDRKMLDGASQILAFCPPEDLPKDLDLKDPRLRLLKVDDPPFGDKYAYLNTAYNVIEVVSEYASKELGKQDDIDEFWKRREMAISHKETIYRSPFPIRNPHS